MRCRKLSILLSFTFLSLFLWSFLIGFCDLAGKQIQEEWLKSGMLSVFIEMVAFEFIPALAVGALGSMLHRCKTSKLFCFILAIESYRALRNVA